MKPANRVLRTAATALFLAWLVGLSGCVVTNKVLDLRKERETRTKEAINFWSLAAVRSAHVNPGGEVFACAEFRDSPADEPQAYTINLEDRNGVRSEVYKFKQGYSQPARISRAVLHGTADILTFGLWEAVGTPTEYVFSGTETIVLVTYNRDERVETVEYFKEGEQGK